MATDEPETQSERADLTPGLVARLRSGDPEAGAHLDQLYREALVRFCWGYLGRIEEAEDAVQDICYKVLTAKTVPDGFRAWLYGIARHHCLNLQRERARRKDGGVLPAASEIHELLTGHLTRLVKQEHRCRISELVRALPEAEREVLRLRYVEDLSRCEIASILEISESAVKSRLFLGLKRLREEVSSPDDD